MEIKMLWIYKPGLFSRKCSMWVLNFVWFRKKEEVYLGISSQGSSHGARLSKSHYRGSAFRTEGKLQWWMTLYTYNQYLKCLKLYEKSIRLKKKPQTVVGNTITTIAFECIFFDFWTWFLIWKYAWCFLYSTSLARNQSYKNFFASISHIITIWFCLQLWRSEAI